MKVTSHHFHLYIGSRREIIILLCGNCALLLCPLIYTSRNIFWGGEIWNKFISKNQNSKGCTYNSWQISMGRPELRLQSSENQVHLQLVSDSGR